MFVVFLLGLILSQSEREAEYRFETTIRVSSTGGGVIRASAPIPRQWREQRIEAGPPETVRCKAKIEPAPPGAESLTIATERLKPKEEAIVKYVQRVFVRPQPQRRAEDFPSLPKLDAKVKAFVTPTPTIDSSDAAIKAKAAEICEGESVPWEKARKLSQWTFNHLDYKLMSYTSAKDAFQTKVGDCEERSSLFIALCRSQGIPARSVISPGKKRTESGHCWSEILLAGKDGEAEWIPVDVGLRWFGELPVAPPILQKGDNYPKLGAGRQRLAGSWARGGSGNLTLEFEQEVAPISANAILDPTQLKSRTR
jgi:transglutaminase-like putative cysteine protease